MESRAFDVETTVASRFLVGAREVLVMPIGDIQYGSEGCDIQRLKRHIDWGVKNGAYFIGMGDYLDVASPSNRLHLAQAGLYDSVKDALDAQLRRQEAVLKQVLAPSKGRWLGLLAGHHMHQYQTGETADESIAEFLETPFLGRCAVVILKLGTKKNPTLCRIWAHHGEGAGATLAAPMAKLERHAASTEADIFLMAHYHRKLSTKIPYMQYKLLPDGTIEQLAANRVLAITGGFLRGYELGTKRGHRPEGSYVEQKMLPPTAVGGIVLYIRARRPRRGHSAVDIDVSL